MTAIQASLLTAKKPWCTRLAYHGDVVARSGVAQFDAFSQRVARVGTRSRTIRGSTSDDRVGCSASDGRCAPARPALHVSTRLLPFLPCALASADGIRPFPLLRLL